MRRGRTSGARSISVSWSIRRSGSTGAGSSRTLAMSSWLNLLANLRYEAPTIPSKTKRAHVLGLRHALCVRAVTTARPNGVSPTLEIGDAAGQFLLAWEEL